MTTGGQKKQRKERIIEWLVAGVTKQEIINILCDNYGVGFKAAHSIYLEALSDIRMTEEEKEALREINIMRLEKIYTESLKKPDYSAAIRAIDAINKTARLYEKEGKKADDSDYMISFG